MRPVLHPALSHTWRDESTLQIGAAPGIATVLGGLGPVERSLVAAMNGQHDLPALRELAIELGSTAAAADRVVDVLLSSGSAIDADQACATPPAPPASSAPSRASASNLSAPSRAADERCQPDRSSVALQDRSPDGGHSALNARAALRVKVNGGSRIGSQVTRLLAAAGIGEVTITDPAPVQVTDLCPGGLGSSALGRHRDRVLAGIVQADSIAPPLPAGGTPDFVVLASTTDTGRDEAAALLRLGVPHLLVQIVEITGIIGPLVVPGESSCVRCHDLHRTDRDHHWPLILDQMTRRPPAEPACDVSLSATVAGLAAIQVLAHLDGFAAAAVNGTLEVTLPYGLPRRRSWSRHAECGCGWQ